MTKPFLCILAAAAIALGAISELRAFEPTDKTEASVYDTRLIPAPGKTVGDTVDFGGLLGTAPVIVQAFIFRHRPGCSSA